MWSDETWKVAHRCGEKHISKSKCTKHLSSGTLLEVEMSKKCAPLWQSKCTKHLMFGPLLEVEMSKKCTLLWREAHFQVKSAKNCRARITFGRSDVVSHGRCKGLGTLSKGSKRLGFCSISAFPKTMAGVGHLKRICKMHVPWQAQYKRHVHQSC